ncbi:3'-5' exonuclease [Boothiomyces sp. JEL0866]|nr:3'-5' exonuclease [Boothiomyces sp. JEL0866]
MGTKKIELSSNWKKLQAAKIVKPKARDAAKNQVVKKVAQHLNGALEDSVDTKKRDLEILNSVLEDGVRGLPSDDDDSDNEKSIKQSKSEKKILAEEARINTIHRKDAKIGKYVAIDCEMVGVGPNGSTSVLARVSIVNFHCQVLLDEYVQPVEYITDYRTKYSGITPKLLKEKGKPFKQVQKMVAELLKDKIIIGHALKNDFAALMLDHPARMTRDTARYKPLKNPETKNSQSLKILAKQELGADIQTGSHSSVEDASTTMMIYKKHKVEWEAHMFRNEKILRPHSW